MSKVLTFSRVFPSYHPRKGEPTGFIEKIYRSIYDGQPSKFFDAKLGNIWLDPHCEGIKHHTIRAGHRFKVGDTFSPRVWSDKPYQSKQIIIAPDIEVKNVWDFKIKEFTNGWYIDFGRYIAIM